MSDEIKVDAGLAAKVRKLEERVGALERLVSYLKSIGVVPRDAGFARVGALLALVAVLACVADVAIAETVTFPIFDQTTYGNGKFTANSATAKTTLTVDYVAGATLTSATVTGATVTASTIQGNSVVSGGTLTNNTITKATITGNSTYDGAVAASQLTGNIAAARITNAVYGLVTAGTTTLGAGGTETIVYGVTFASNPYIVATYGEDPGGSTLIYLGTAGTTSCAVTGTASKKINWVAVQR